MTIEPEPEVGAHVRLLEIRNSPAHLIRLAHRQMMTSFEENVAPHGLTVPQFALLWTVELAPGLEQAELAALASFDPATTAGVIGRLEKMELVSRARSNRSRRGRAVTLTPKGVRCMAKIRPTLAGLGDQLFVNLSPDERMTFMRLMTKMLAAKNDFDDSGAAPERS